MLIRSVNQQPLRYRFALQTERAAWQAALSFPVEGFVARTFPKLRLSYCPHRARPSAPACPVLSSVKSYGALKLQALSAA